MPKGLTAPVSQAGHAIDRQGLSLVMAPSGFIIFNQQVIGGPAELAKRLAHERQSRALHSPEKRPSPRPLYVIADVGTELVALDAILSAVPASLELRLVVLGPAQPTQAYERELRANASVQRFIDTAGSHDPSTRAMHSAEHLELAIGDTCPAVAKAFGEVATKERSQKSTFMAEALPEALAACRCQVLDHDLVDYAMLALFNAFEAPQQWLPLKRKHGTSDATRVGQLVR